MNSYQFLMPLRIIPSYSAKLALPKSLFLTAAMMSLLAMRALFRATLTPLEKIGSTKRAASPTRTKLSPQTSFMP